MNATPPDSTPAAIPWYRSSVLRNLAIVAVTQILAHFHIAAMFTTAEVGDIADYILDAIGALAAAGIAHARVTLKPQPPVTLTKAGADAIVAATPSATATAPVQPQAPPSVSKPS